jgi:hypothetical protein
LNPKKETVMLVERLVSKLNMNDENNDRQKKKMTKKRKLHELKGTINQCFLGTSKSKQ